MYNNKVHVQIIYGVNFGNIFITKFTDDILR